MAEPASTVSNSKTWRVWHGINYQIGGITFLLGSIALLPALVGKIDGALISAWFYTVGSAAFLLADITEWLHYTKPFFPQYTLNFLFSVIGSTFYLVGSICYIPSLDAAKAGALYFIIGSSVIVFAQTWKIIRSLFFNDKPYWRNFFDDESGFYVDLYAGLGALMYLVGTVVLNKSASDPDYLLPGVLIYCLGGFFFTLSGIYMQKRYFFEDPKGKNGYEPTAQ